MGRYRARDLWLWPNLVSLLRVPLALLFPWVVEWPFLALVVLGMAGASDVLDGFLARRLGQATATGAVIDGLTDKAFAASVVATLYFTERVDEVALLMLGAREIGELPLVLWWALSRHRRRARAEEPKANALGKAATVSQFAAVAACLLGSPLLPTLLPVTAAVGTLAAVSYWRRELA